MSVQALHTKIKESIGHKDYSASQKNALVGLLSRLSVPRAEFDEIKQKYDVLVQDAVIEGARISTRLENKKSETDNISDRKKLSNRIQTAIDDDPPAENQAELTTLIRKLNLTNVAQTNVTYGKIIESIRTAVQNLKDTTIARFSNAIKTITPIRSPNGVELATLITDLEKLQPKGIVEINDIGARGDFMIEAGVKELKAKFLERFRAVVVSEKNKPEMKGIIKDLENSNIDTLGAVIARGIELRLLSTSRQGGGRFDIGRSKPGKHLPSSSSAAPKWVSTNRQTTLKEGTKRTVYRNTSTGERATKRMTERNGKRTAKYVKI